VKELSSQRNTRRTATPSHSVCGLPAVCTHDMRQSRSKSNLGNNNHLATSRSNLTQAATLSTYRASTPRVHSTRSVAVGYGRRSMRSTTSRAPHRLPRLRMEVSFRRPGSASPPTTRDPPDSASVVSANDPLWVGTTDSEEAHRIQANANRAQRRAEE
jgi:hypothetical protein